MQSFEEIARLTEEAIESRVFPGGVIGVLDKSGRRAAPFGHLTYELDSSAVTEETLYDCASITKSIPTATLALQLMDEGKLSLGDKLISYIPEYHTRHREEVRIRHLLTYTLGNTTSLSSLADKTPDEIFAAVCTEEMHPPGTAFSYSNIPAFLLGTVIERILGTSLDKAATERIFKPLDMTSITFHPNVRLRKSNIAPTEIVDGNELQGIVHDESARVFAKAGKVVGHAGLFSTMPDLLTFLENLLANPDKRLCTSQIVQLNASTALGWELNQSWMGEKRSSKTFGKTGFTGTSIVCDFERQTAIAVLCNRTYPKRPADTSAINAFRSAVCDIVFK